MAAALLQLLHVLVLSDHPPPLLLSPGNRYWVFSESTMEKDSPKSLKDLGTGLPEDKIDAALFYTPTGQTYFFRGTQ